MVQTSPARDGLWDLAVEQHGFVTARQATGLAVSKQALQMLVRRGTLQRVAHGVYRFPRYPVGPYDNHMLAVLWTRCPEAALSHETALDVYGISDVNPNRIHVTVGRDRRLRRTDGDDYAIHYENLMPAQIGWWQQIPTVTAATAIDQCMAYGTPTHLLRQAVEQGRAQGYLTLAESNSLSSRLAAHDGG